MRDLAEQLTSDLMIPTEDHPYDHFLVIGKVDLPLPLLRVNDYKYRQKFKPEDLTMEDIKKID